MRNVTLTYDRGEQLADRCVHGVGLVAGPLGAVLLIAAAAGSGNALVSVSVAIYGVGLVAMIGASALYNLAPPSRRKEWFRRLDHAAIFLMIAGTYTPFALARIGGAWGLGIAGFVWLAAIAGIAMKLICPRRLERFTTGLYLALGWAILLALGPLFDSVSPAAIILIGVGGLLYSVGVVFHLWRRLPYHNAIWHGFVLAAAACHWVAVLAGVVRAA